METKMKKSLMMTVAAGVLIACASVAMAQAPGVDEHEGKGPAHSTMQPKAGPAGVPSPRTQENTKPGAGPAAQIQPNQAPARTNNEAPTEHERTGQNPQSPNGSRVGQEQNNPSATQRRAQETSPQNDRHYEHATTQEGRDRNDNRVGEQPKENNERVGQGRVNEHNTTSTNESAAPNHAAQGGRRPAPAVKLSQDQRTRIQNIIVRNRDVVRIDHPDFSVSVGVRIPRDVHVMVIPEDIVTIVPEYRGFDYVMVGDQVLIIDPDSLEIVAIINA